MSGTQHRKVAGGGGAGVVKGRRVENRVTERLHVRYVMTRRIQVAGFCMVQ